MMLLRITFQAPKYDILRQLISLDFFPPKCLRSGDFGHTLVKFLPPKDERSMEREIKKRTG